MIREINMDRKRKHLLLPDGRYASELRLLALYAELERLRIPGIDASMGKAALLDAYEARLRVIADDLLLQQRSSHPTVEAQAFEIASKHAEKLARV